VLFCIFLPLYSVSLYEVSGLSFVLTWLDKTVDLKLAYSSAADCERM